MLTIINHKPPPHADDHPHHALNDDHPLHSDDDDPHHDPYADYDDQEGATARLLSLGARLPPNERDNQVMCNHKRWPCDNDTMINEDDTMMMIMQCMNDLGARLLPNERDNQVIIK